jgi:hypothetical protein
LEVNASGSFLFVWCVVVSILCVLHTIPNYSHKFSARLQATPALPEHEKWHNKQAIMVGFDFTITHAFSHTHTQSLLFMHDSATDCTSWMVVPAWNELPGSFRALVYVVVLLYCLLGVHVVMDVLMASVLKITSQLFITRKGVSLFLQYVCLHNFS